MTKLITFEGIEGVGKSTQIEMLNSFIVDSGYSSKILREPGSTRFGEDVRNLLLNSDHDISSNSELLLMFAARSELVNAFLKETKTDFILCDRFYDASVAYQGYGRGLDLKFINSLINFINCPEPDITFLLDLDPTEGFKRKSSDKMDRIESSGLEFFDRVRNGYLNQAHSNPQRIKVLDASENVTSINLKIIEFTKIFL